MIGHDQFSDNLGKYFKKYGFKNATLKQFLEMVAVPKEGATLPQSISDWSADWIGTAGLNHIEVEWDPSKQGE